MKSRKRGKKERDELVSLLFLALLFFVLLAGRELGSIYNGYGEISRLSVLFQLDEVSWRATWRACSEGRSRT